MVSPPPTLGSIAEGPLSLSSSGGLSWKSAEERGGRWDDGPSPQPPRSNDTEEREGEGTITHYKYYGENRSYLGG